MNRPVAIPPCLKAICRQARIFVVVSVSVISFAQAPVGEGGDASKWATFANRGGWSIRYPPDLRVSSCRQCEDPTDPNVPVAFSRSSGEVVAMIEPLADKRAGQNTRQWLAEVEHDTVLIPVLSEQWTFIDGAPALVATNGASSSEQTENIYIARGLKTLAIRFPHTQEVGIRSVCQQMLSTVRFSTR
jgi:hypothetical protein